MRLVPELYDLPWDESARNMEEILQQSSLYDSTDENDGPASPEAPTLHDLFDVSPEDPNEEAVNSMFPDSLFSAEEGNSENASQLKINDMDLQCYEGMPSSPEGCNSEEVREPQNELVLDCPVRPGHNCRACAFHRTSSGNVEAICSLCYMRLTGNFVYSKYKTFIMGNNVEVCFGYNLKAIYFYR